jgi:YVTN family beta-propeller protein
MPVGELPVSVAVTPDGARVYVTARTSRQVVVVDTATNTVVTTIPLPIAIHDIPPRNKDACRDGGFRQFGALGFRNQGQCIKYVNEHAK